MRSWLFGDQPADLHGLPEPQRTLSALRLRELVSMAPSLARERFGQQLEWTDRVPALSGSLRIFGGRIEGGFRIPRPDVSSPLRMSLWFQDCVFDTPIDLCGAELLSVRIIGCRLPAFLGSNVNVTADVDLSGSQLSGIEHHASELGDVPDCSVYLNGSEIGGRLSMTQRGGDRFEAFRGVRLEGARVDGDVVLDGGRLDGAGAKALDARAIQVGGGIRMQPVGERCFEAHGEVSLSAAQITGDLEAGGALILNGEGRALHCEDLRVESVVLGAVEELPFRAAGRLNFLSAVIGGNFILSGARLRAGPDYAGRVARGGPVCINLQQVRVSNAMVMRDVAELDLDCPEKQRLEPRPKVSGWFLLSGAQVRTLIDEPSAWPERGFLLLEGLTYERIAESGGVGQAKPRIEWLRLQFPEGGPTMETFRPQPYEQFAQTMRAQGRREEADAIAVEQVRVRLRAKVDPRPSRMVRRLLLWVSLHGYSSARALAAFVLFIAFGSVLYGTALWGFDQPFVPVEHDPEPTEYVTAFGWLRTTHVEGCPALVVPFFALDAAMPIVDVGQSSTCRFEPTGEARWLWLLLHSIYSVLGAALSAIVVLTLSGLMRRDGT